MNHSATVIRYFSIVLVLVIVLLAIGNRKAIAASSGKANSITLVDTPKFSIPFTVNMNNFTSDGVNFGVHPSATAGIDTGLGEREYPPFPIGGGFAMFVTAGGNAILDLHPWTSPTQIDTYHVGMALDSENYPIKFSWPDLHPYYSGSVRLKADLGGSMFDIDMKAQNSYTLASGPFYSPWGPPPFGPTLSVYIIAEGPLPGNSLPLVSTYGVGGGGFQAIVNTAGGAAASGSGIAAVTGSTGVWFEYGPSTSYGTSTTVQAVPDGSHMNITEPFDPSSLPMNTRIHFRAVALSNLGTFYGGDWVVSNGTPPPETSADTTRYRTATYRDWADAKDQKNKRKAIKGKPDKVEFIFYLQGDAILPHTSTLTMKFSMPTTGFITALHEDSTIAIGSWADAKTFVLEHRGESAIAYVLHYKIIGYGSMGKELKVSYTWVRDSNTKLKAKNSLPDHPRTQWEHFSLNQPKLPMPNLHNVGEDIFGGTAQSPVIIRVGSTDDPKGAHTVYHPKYSDVVKSLVKEKRGGDIYHTALPHCLDTFDKNGAVIKKKQKSLPPDKHNNKLFAYQLALKLNIAASDSGIFPPGLGDLIYDNSGVKGTPGPFDGMTIRQIADSVDKYLGCNGDVAGTHDSTEFLKVDSLINVAFAGPMDTTSWSGGKVFCTGARMLMDVPYLHHNPAAVPRIDFARGPFVSYTQQPSIFALRQNYPNPFNPTTTIEFELKQDAFVTLKVYNTLGQEVAELIHNELMDEGTQEAEFDATRFASGVYYYRIVVQDVETGQMQFTNVKKMLLVK